MSIGQDQRQNKLLKRQVQESNDPRPKQLKVVKLNIKILYYFNGMTQPIKNINNSYWPWVEDHWECHNL